MSESENEKAIRFVRELERACREQKMVEYIQHSELAARDFQPALAAYLEQAAEAMVILGLIGEYMLKRLMPQ